MLEGSHRDADQERKSLYSCDPDDTSMLMTCHVSKHINSIFFGRRLFSNAP